MPPCARALTSTFSCGSPAGQRRCSGLHRPQTEAEVLEQSAQTLRAHLAALLSALSRSVRACPAVVRATFRQLFRRVRERFPSAQHEVRPLPVGPGGGKKAVGKGAAVAPGGAVLGGWGFEAPGGVVGRGRGGDSTKNQRALPSPGLGESSPCSPAPPRTCHSSPSPASCACASSLPPSWRPSSSTCGSGTRTPAPAAPCSCWPRCGPVDPGEMPDRVPRGPLPGQRCAPHWLQEHL